MTGCTAPRHDEPEQATPSAYLCRPCQGALRGDLRRLPQLDRDLEDMLDTRGSGSGRGGSGGDGLPWHEPAAECRSQIRHDLRYWVTWIIDDRQPAAWPVRSVTAMCAWLHGWAAWIPYQPWAGDMAAALAADRGRAAALLDPRPRTDIPVDRCPRCPDGMLRAAIPLTEGDRRPTLITCNGCGHEWDTTQWLGLGRVILARKAAA